MEYVVVLIIIGIVAASVSHAVHKNRPRLCDGHKWAYKGEGDHQYMQCDRCSFIAGTNPDEGEEV